MAKYLTRQRKRLLAYLSEHTDEQMTARQIADALAETTSASAPFIAISPLWRRKGFSNAAFGKERGKSFINTLPPRNAKTACTSPAGYAAKAFILEKKKRSSFFTVHLKAQAFKSTKRKRFCTVFAPIAENKRW